MTEQASRGFDVFISYSTKDAAPAALIKHQLEASGLRCWKAPDDILPGENWPTAIMRALGICRSVVLVWSRHSMTSSEVSKELTVAMKNGIAVIPFRLEDVEPLGDWAYHLANTHWMDAFPGALEPYVSELGQRLLGLLGEGAPGTRATAVAGEPARRAYLGRWLIPGGLAGVAVVAIGWQLLAGADSRPAGEEEKGSTPPAEVQPVVASVPVAELSPSPSRAEEELATLRDKVQMAEQESALREQVQRAEQEAAEARRLAAEREAELLRQQAGQAEKDRQAALERAALAEQSAVAAQNRAAAAAVQPAFQPTGVWLFPDSSVRRLSRGELAGLDGDQLWRARNEIFARRGYIFQTDKGRRFARQLGSSYRPVSANQDAIMRSMNAVEQHNVELIEAMEKGR